MMKVASKYFTEEDSNEISLAVVEAEKHTSGEIIPIVATVSGRYDRAEDIVGLIFALISVSIGWCLFQDVQTSSGWLSGLMITFGLAPILITIVFGFFVGTLLANLFPVLRTPFIPKSEMQAEVESRAAEVFQKFRIRKTKGSTGILIYVSLYEHMVRILGDDAISKKLNQEDWQSICDIIINGCKNKHNDTGDDRRHSEGGKDVGRAFSDSRG